MEQHDKHPLEPSSRRTSTTAACSSNNHTNTNTNNNESINSCHLDSDHACHRSSSESYRPPFLVRSRSQVEKERMQRQLEQQKRTKSPYDTLRRVYERYSTSALLENKAAVARDHLANERTFLAWLRTSLSLVTVGVAITQLYKLSPDGGHAHSGRAIGATFVVLSIVFLYMANARYFHSQVALTKDRFPASRGAVLFGSTAVLAAIHWEQSIVEGHATHPMHKARRSYAPLPPLNPGEVNLDRPNIRLLSIPRSSIQLRGEFEPLVKPLVDAMLAKRAPGAGACGEDRVLVPVHEFQIPNVQERFKDAQVLPEENSVQAQALTSIRSVAIPDVLKAHTIKLCVGIKVSSALRTITPYTTYFGPGFSANVVPRLSYDRKILTIERELASAVYRHEDTDVAKHCSCVVRETIEHDGEINVVAASLVEKIQKPDTDETLSRHVWGLDTEEKRIAFLDRYIEYALKAFVPPCLENGVAFEAHGQNTMVRFDRKTGELKGFVIRDFGGVKVHNETLKSTCGVELDVLPDSCVVAHTREECYKLLYHTLFHSQLQRLIRVLGLHHNGRGWDMVRKHFTAMVPKDHSMYAYFMEQDKVPGKCLVRMKIQELYRDYIYEPVPNMILSRPQQVIQ